MVILEKYNGFQRGIQGFKKGHPTPLEWREKVGKSGRLRKGKTYEEIYGSEKGKEEREKRKRRVQVTCIICGKTKEKSKYFEKQRFCSIECINIWQRRNQKTKYCLICNKEFKVKPSENDRKFCSLSCSKVRLKETFKEHFEKVKEQVKILEEQGYSCFTPDIKPRPDIIAKKDGKIYAVEVEFQEYPDYDKYNNINFFDDVIWLVFKKENKAKI